MLPRESKRYQKLAATLKEQRDDKGLSQRELAKLLRKPHTYVEKVESGERAVRFLDALDYCDALGITVEWLAQEVRSVQEPKRSRGPRQ